MSQNGNTLITVPCWWDGTSDSLVASVRKERPELLQGYSFISSSPQVIPPDPPPGFFEESGIPGIGQLMSASVFNLSIFDPSNWWVGEKYDGIRAAWLPKSNKIFSRFGNELPILTSLLVDMPLSLLDGEIWCGRGDFAHASKLSGHAHPDKVNWTMLKYLVFDCPDAKLGTFESRYTHIMQALIPHPFTLLAYRFLCEDKAQLKACVSEILKDGGEGVILRKPHSLYEYGRSANLVKIKAHRDSEAQILQVNQHSCVCKITTGIILELPYAPIFDHRKRPKIGDVVSFFHSGFFPQSGKPRQAAMVRQDLSWQQVANTYKQGAPRFKSVEETKRGGGRMLSVTSMIVGYWNHESNHRKFLERFARNAQFNPLVADNWQNVKARDIIVAGGRALLYHGSPKRAILHAFPEFRSSLSQAHRHQKGHWQDTQNCRLFFDEFAKLRRIDPLNPNDWYTISNENIRDAGGGSLMATYSGFRHAIQQAYPNLNFVSQNFRTAKNVHHESGYWTNAQNCKLFLMELAEKKGIDPSNPSQWLNLPLKEILSSGGKGMLKYYDNSHIQAISELFNLNLTQFRKKQQIK